VTVESGRSTAEPIALRERASATPLSPERPVRHPAETRVGDDGSVRPTSLAAQQEWFARAVMTPESVPAPVGASQAASILTAGPKLDPLGRLEIYRHAYHARLIECLLDDYPAVAATLGEADFDELCRKYIATYPSTGSNLNGFGAHMASLCRAEAAEPAAIASRELGSFVADLAALEWAIVEVIHAASADPLTMTGLAAIPAGKWADARLVATPAFRLLRFAYPVNAYFQAFREEREPEVPLPQASSVVVYQERPHDLANGPQRSGLRSAARAHFRAEPRGVARRARARHFPRSTRAKRPARVTAFGFATGSRAGSFPAWSSRDGRGAARDTGRVDGSGRASSRVQPSGRRPR
jgi:hypothetical protein